MGSYFVLSDYIFHAMKSAQISALEEGTFAGRIPSCQGVVAFGKTREECLQQLQSTLESWILLGIKSGHTLPIIHGINLNQEPSYEFEFSL